MLRDLARPQETPTLPTAAAAPPELDARFVRRYYDQRVAAASAYVQTRWLSDPADCKRYYQTLLTLHRVLGASEFDSIIEIGSGPGVWTGLLSSRARRVVSVDISIGMLQQFPVDLNRNAAVHRVCADFTRAPFGAESADGIFCIRAFEYFPDKIAAAAELARIGRSGCKLLVITKNPDHGRRDERAGPAAHGDKIRLHSGQLRPNELVAVLRRCGFARLRVRPVTLVQTRLPVVWALCDIVQALAWKCARGDALPLGLRRHVESYAVTGVLFK